MAATPRGVCAISFGETDAALEAALRREYPAASVVRDDGGLQIWVETLVQHLAGAQSAPSLPLDVRATAFQRRVWQELQAIPPGQTRSYGQVAAAIGQPRAVRAVARACASNPTALAVLCPGRTAADAPSAHARAGARSVSRSPFCRCVTCHGVMRGGKRLCCCLTPQPSLPTAVLSAHCDAGAPATLAAVTSWPVMRAPLPATSVCTHSPRPCFARAADVHAPSLTLLPPTPPPCLL